MLKLTESLDSFADGFPLPKDAATQVYAFMGKRGSGKTYAAGRLVEVLSALAVQVIVLDPVGNWYGLRLAADGQSPGIPIPILGGEHGDIELDAEGGEAVADALVDSGSSAVLDLSSFSKGDRRRFIVAFAEHLFHRKKTRRTPCHIVIEEAHLVLPQATRDNGEKRMLGALEDLVRLGRNYGIGVSMLDQRPQSVSKEALNQAEVLFAFRLVGAHERDAIKKWFDAHETEMLDVKKLEPGQTFTWAPWLDNPRVVQVNRKWTYDASSTPESGDQVEHGELKPLDLEALRGAMSRSGAKVTSRGDEATELQVRTYLDAIFDAVEGTSRDRSITDALGIAAYADLVTAAVHGLRKDALAFADMLGAAERKIRGMEDNALLGANRRDAIESSITHLDRVLDELKYVLGRRPKPPEEETPTLEAPTPADEVIIEARQRAETMVAATEAAPRARIMVLPERNPHEHGDVKRQVLGAILYMGRPLRIDEIAILCGYSAGASTVGTYVSALRKEGLVTPEGVPARGLVDLTAKGRRDATKAPKPLPSEQRITWWCAQLGKHGDVLRLLCEVYPERIHHDTLCKRLSYSKDASTMGTYLSALRKKGLITRERGPVAASPHLFLEPER